MNSKEDIKVDSNKKKNSEETTRAISFASSLWKRFRALGKSGKNESFDTLLGLAVAESCLSEGVWDWNIVENRFHFSRKCLEQLGYKAEEIESTYSAFLQLISFESKQFVENAMAEHFSKKTPFHLEFQAVTKFGDMRWIQARGQAIWNDKGEAVRMICSHTDITHMKRLELELSEARKSVEFAKKAKAEFLANIRHEIRTPMNSILGTAQLLSETSLTTAQKAILEQLLRGSNQLKNHLNDIFDIIKIEANDLVLEKVAFSPMEKISEIFDFMQAEAQDKNLFFELAKGQSMNSFVLGDPIRYQKIVKCLLANAIKYTPAGGKIFVEVSTEAFGDGAVFVHFSVKDSGIGMNEKTKNNLFQKFEQGESADTRRFGGTGIGLSITKYLVEKMGGKIQVESSLGFGSTFLVVVPFPYAETQVHSFPQQISVAERKRVLLVEDAEDNRLLIRAYLKKANIELEMAENGSEGVEKYKTGNFDIVLMDIQMPVMDGYQATKKIREWELSQNIPAIPIIAITASSLPGDRERSLANGFNFHALKPISKKELLDLIEMFSAKKAA